MRLLCWISRSYRRLFLYRGDSTFVPLLCVADVGYYVGQRIYGRSELSESTSVWDQIVVRFQEPSESFINYFF